MDQEMKAYLDAMQQGIIKQMVDLNTETRTESRDHGERLNGQTREYIEKLHTQAHDHAEQLNAQTREYVEKLHTQAHDHAEQLSAQTREYVEKLHTQAHDHAEQLNAQTRILIEAVHDDIRLVAEGVVMFNEKLDRIAGDHEQRIQRLERGAL